MWIWFAVQKTFDVLIVVYLVSLIQFGHCFHHTFCLYIILSNLGYRGYYLRSPLDFILDATLMVSPNRQYRGSFDPTIPAMHGPVK